MELHITWKEMDLIFHNSKQFRSYHLIPNIYEKFTTMFGKEISDQVKKYNDNRPGAICKLVPMEVVLRRIIL